MSKKKNSLTKYFLSALVSLLLILYIIYHLANSFGSDIETTPASLVDVNETISVDAYIFREEIVLTSEKEGGVNALYSDGTMVRKNAAIANVYASDDTDSIQSRITSIENQIKILKDASTYESTNFIDSSTVTSELDTLFYNIQSKINQNDIDYVLKSKNELLTLMNKRQLAQQTMTSFSEQIAELESEKAELTASISSITDTVYSPVAGYFSSDVDGYEEIFDVKRLDTLSYDEFQNLIQSDPREYSGNVIGKVASDYVWYIVCLVDSDRATDFLYANDYSVIFPYSADNEITMTLYRSVANEDDTQTMLVFKTGEIPDDFNFLRKQSVEIVVRSFKGYKVPVSAVHIVDGAQGVYILSGSVVEFKEITPLTEIDGNLIVEENTADENSQNKLAYYDQIITKGKNLYANKVIG